MDEPLVYIILLNYNGYEDTIKCVETLNKIDYNNYKILIVDNASTDNSIAVMNKKLVSIDLVPNTINEGFAGGNNLGIKFALKRGADYILMLNNDTLVEPRFLYNMLSTFNKAQDIGIVGCKIMYYPETNKIWYAGGYIDWFKFIGKHRGMSEIDNGQYDNEEKIDFMTGCCMLVKREVFEKVGLLSEEYFMYLEDVDFCVKVAENNFKIWYNPKAIIYHKVGSSNDGEESSFLIEWVNRNRLIFMNKYKYKVSENQLVLSKMFFYCTRIFLCFKYIFTGKTKKCFAIISGIKKYNNLNN